MHVRRFARSLASVAVLFAAFACPNGFCQDLPVTLTPPPRQVVVRPGPPLGLPNGHVAIVLGTRAEAPERYAAEMLAEKVSRRFGKAWPIVSEQDDLSDYAAVILAGQRSTHRTIDRLLSNQPDVAADTLSRHDGYFIDMVPDDSRQVIIICGANARGVIYGQDTLFQLLQRIDNGGEVAVSRACVKDWPSVPWRGRPHTHYRNYLRPGDLDAYMDARINWIDLRNDTYAFEPGAELDTEEIGRVVAEAHRRGLVVYGAVNCGVANDEHPEILKTYEEFIALGADGLCLSFDDKGPGEAPEQIVPKVLDMARRHGIAGPLISITPPKGDYQDIDTAFNRKIAAIEGMSQALWLWTRWPAARFLEQAKSIGLETRPGWWHNWPRLYTPHVYIEPPSMAVGWHSPGYDVLADGGRYIEAVMPWGGSTWGPHYIVPVIGWWAWSPTRHDWSATRSRIYDIVYGPDLVDTAMRFDDALVDVKRQLAYSGDSSRWHPPTPARLKDQNNSSRVLTTVREMQSLLKRLDTEAPEGTLLEKDQLEDFYLNRMAGELATIESAATLPYPEYWWNAHQRRLLTAIYDNRVDDAARLIAEGRRRVVDTMNEIAGAAGHIRRKDEYVSWWRERAALDVEGWQQLLAERRVAMRELVGEYAWFVAVPGKLLAGAEDPPLDWGSGRWQASNELLATVLPTEREYAWGNWMGGLMKDGTATVFVARRKNHSVPGEYSELDLEIPVGDADPGRLRLLFFVNHAHKDAIGGQETTARWAGYRFLELRSGDRVIWETDLGRPRPDGEWFMVDLSDVPVDEDTMNLGLRVIDRKLITVNHTIVLVSPMYLLLRQE